VKIIKETSYFSLVYSYLYGFAKKILSLAVKNIQASLIFLDRLFVSLWLRQEDTFTRCEKYSSKLDISRSFIRIFMASPRRYFHSL